MDNSILILIGFIILVAIMAIASEMFFMLIGWVVGLIVFFAPIILIFIIGEKLQLHGLITGILSIAWIVIGCMFLSSVFK